MYMWDKLVQELLRRVALVDDAVQEPHGQGPVRRILCSFCQCALRRLIRIEHQFQSFHNHLLRY